MHPQFVMPPSFPLGIENMTQKDYAKFIKNLLMFTAPMLAIFFGQLATGVPFQAAFWVALIAFWGALADLFNKMQKEEKPKTKKTK